MSGMRRRWGPGFNRNREAAVLRYRKLVVDTIWAEQSERGEWLIRLTPDAPVSRVMSNDEFWRTYTVDDTGGIGHMNLISRGNR